MSGVATAVHYFFSPLALPAFLQGTNVTTVLVTHRAGSGTGPSAPGWVVGRDHCLDAAIADVKARTIGAGIPLTFAPEVMDAEDPLFILYTSG